MRRPAPPGPPASEQELLARAEALAGRSAGELAALWGRELPQDPRRAKGKLGELLELCLGATAGNQDLPDFPDLGVELKTVPVSRSGRVRESTFVCAVDLGRVHREEWQTSRVWRKLRRVLWVPLLVEGPGPPAARRLGNPLLWSPDPEQEAQLRADWMDLVGRICVGGIEEISAHLGQALQLRPKARDASVRAECAGPEGEVLRAGPLGFYLRARYTEALLWRGLGP